MGVQGAGVAGGVDGGVLGGGEGGGEEAVAGEGDEGADVVHDGLKAGGEDGSEAGAVEVGAGEVGEGVGGGVDGGWPHRQRDVGALPEGLVEDDDRWGSRV